MTKSAHPHGATGDQVSLGRALQALRRTAGLTQVELASRLDIHPSYVSQVERGRRGVRWHTVRSFLTALGADLHQLADEIAVAERADSGEP